MIFINNTYSTDPTFNLAFEEYVFESMDQDETYFMLWQNDHAIIVGKHQNTIEEINQDFVKEQGIKVVRRLTGGGAVYHDLGNLNFTFIVNNDSGKPFDFQSFTRPVVKALQSLGVNAEFNGRNDITIDGKKFSGNSQYAKRGRVLHHGTVLFNSKLDTVQRALKVKKDKIESKGVKSVKSRVTNIADYLDPDFTLEDFKKALVSYMFEDGELKERSFTQEDIAAIKKLQEEKYATWEWNYGRSPEYNLRRERKYPCGLVTVLMTVDRGIIKDIHFYGDFFGNGDITKLEGQLVGSKPEESVLRRLLQNNDLSDYINGMTDDEFIDLMLY